MQSMNQRALADELIPRLFEDEHYLFVHKPAGLAVNTQQKGRPAGVVEALDALGAETGLRPCFKLEKYTSGVLVLAKTPTAGDRFAEAIKRGDARLTYAAVVRGKVKPPPAADRARRSPPGRPRPKTKPAAPKRLPVELIRQFDQCALVRMSAQQSGGTRVRAALRGLRLPVLDDARFDPRPGKPQSGRFYLHLEEITFKHPVTGANHRVFAPIPPLFERVARGDSKLEAHLDAALAARMPCLLDDQTDAFRLLNASVDGVSGLMAEKLGNVLILHALQGKFQGDDQTLVTAAKWYAKNLGIKTAFAKRIPLDRGRASKLAATDRDPTGSAQHASPIWGRPAESEITISEHGIHYIVRPNDGFMTGLFLDHRDNRARMRRIARGKRVLNLFSYTCGFTVAAAIGKARSTVSVDLSKKYLEWGKGNLSANNIDLDDHRFYCCDAFEYFKRAERQEHRFDVIILDPPTFSRTKKPAGVFQVTKDMPRLIATALRFLDRSGEMLVSTNHGDLSTAWLRECVTDAARRRPFKVTDAHPPPPDFAGARDAAKSIWLQFD